MSGSKFGIHDGMDGTILAMAAMDMLCMSQGHADRHRAGKGGSVPGQNRLGLENRQEGTSTVSCSKTTHRSGASNPLVSSSARGFPCHNNSDVLRILLLGFHLGPGFT